ncbi:hypothetical protein J6590_096652, partial [Homalodisca vitripennis]
MPAHLLYKSSQGHTTPSGPDLQHSTQPPTRQILFDTTCHASLDHPCQLIYPEHRTTKASSCPNLHKN